MSFKVIATWRMAYESLLMAQNDLKKGMHCNDLLEKAISYIEDYPYYKSVGYGGLPNEDGYVECDAAFMNGETLAIGAVAGVRSVKNPVKLARLLSQQRYNSFMVGQGAEIFAIENNLEITNMLTPRAHKIWENKKAELRDKNIGPYDGHDTVGMICLDGNNHMSAATSTSGLFFKHPGRVGDSPLSGSGFYCDEKIGAACATGLGEDIMKGCLSFAIVEELERKTPIQIAADKIVFAFERKLKERYKKAGEISVVTMNAKGEWAISTNVEFSFVVCDEDAVVTYVAHPNVDHSETIYEKASDKFMEDYLIRIKKPV